MFIPISIVAKNMEIQQERGFKFFHPKAEALECPQNRRSRRSLWGT